MGEFAGLLPFVLTPFIMGFFVVALDVLGIIALVSDGELQSGLIANCFLD